MSTPHSAEKAFGWCISPRSNIASLIKRGAPGERLTGHGGCLAEVEFRIRMSDERRMRARLVVLAGVVFAACSNSPVRLQPGQLVLRPLTIDFGVVSPGTSEERTLELFDRGGAPVVLSRLRITGDAQGSFSIVDQPELVEVGATVTVRLRYLAAGVDRIDTARLEIESDAANGPTFEAPLLARVSAADAGSGDAGSGDAGNEDAGSEDAGSEDAGSGDAGSEDAGPPSNDDCAGAIQLSWSSAGYASAAGSTRFARDDYSLPCVGDGGRDVIYSVVLPAQASVRAHAYLPDGTYAPIAIANGCPPTSFTGPLACFDPAMNRPPYGEATLLTPAFGTYYIVVEGPSDGGGGPFQLTAAAN